MHLASQSSYVGRFAPSPSGPLHFGSLVCALASYLHAKQHHGTWLVRIEDIDTPRIDPKMNQVILDSLAIHGLHWDKQVSYQSQRHTLYEKTLQQLNAQGLLYACTCSRRQIRARAGSYDGHCRSLGLPFEGNALRFMQSGKHAQFYDLHLGQQNIQHKMASEDPVLRRADGIYAYHLAVIADDIDQGVTHIVRGIDLLETTPIHLSLYHALKQTPSQYLHIPVVVQKSGEKLSKQHYSPAINDAQAINNLKLALHYLGLQSKSAQLAMEKIQKIDSLLLWAIEHWTPKMLAKQSEMLISVANGVYSIPPNSNEAHV